MSCIIPGVLLAGVTAAENAIDNTNGQVDIQSVRVLGRPLSAEEQSQLSSHIFADGAQLPDGQGSIEAGMDLYQQQCASCHGRKGEGGRALELVGDRTLLTTEFPDKGIGVYWPYAPTLFQYIQRAMPPDKPGRLTNDELYSLIGYLLHLNDLLPGSGTLDRQSLIDLILPNRDGFVDQLTYSIELKNRSEE